MQLCGGVAKLVGAGTGVAAGVAGRAGRARYARAPRPAAIQSRFDAVVCGLYVSFRLHLSNVPIS